MCFPYMVFTTIAKRPKRLCRCGQAALGGVFERFTFCFEVRQVGVLGIISDMGPLMTVESFGMCVKTNNVCVYRGGAEWLHTNEALFRCLQEAAVKEGVPEKGLIFSNYSAKKIEKVLDTVFLTFFTLRRHRTLVTRPIRAGALKLAERV